MFETTLQRDINPCPKTKQKLLSKLLSKFVPSKHERVHVFTSRDPGGGFCVLLVT